jgi:hypothetical protein
MVLLIHVPTDERRRARTDNVARSSTSAASMVSENGIGTWPSTWTAVLAKTLAGALARDTSSTATVSTAPGGRVMRSRYRTDPVTATTGDRWMGGAATARLFTAGALLTEV